MLCLIKPVFSVIPPSPPVEVPSGFDLGHTVFTVGVISLGAFGVAESTAADGVDGDEEEEDDNVEDRELVPVSSDRFEDSSFAGIALIAEHVWGVVPPVTVGVLCHRRRQHIVA